MAAYVSAAHFVFIHGACHGAWCWYKVRTLLESVGHKVTCLDLASAGIDRSDPDQISSFEEYNRPLTDFMATLPEDEKVILVGHSAGGSSVTDAIYKFGEKIQLVVYVVAAMIRTNVGSRDPPAFSPDDVIYNYGFGPSLPPTSLIFRKEALRRLLYNRSPYEDSTLASMLIRPIPIVKQSEEDISNDKVDEVRRVYVRTTDDHMISVSRQDVMIKGWQPWKVFDVDSDHCPYFSAPTQLFSILLQVTNSIATDGL